MLSEHGRTLYANALMLAIQVSQFLRETEKLARIETPPRDNTVSGFETDGVQFRARYPTTLGRMWRFFNADDSQRLLQGSNGGRSRYHDFWVRPQARLRAA